MTLETAGSDASAHPKDAVAKPARGVQAGGRNIARGVEVLGQGAPPRSSQEAPAWR
jgi:hypothetical protein